MVCSVQYIAANLLLWVEEALWLWAACSWRGEREPGEDVEAIQHRFEEGRGLQTGCTELKQEHVGVHHGVTEVALDVGHRLALDL